MPSGRKVTSEQLQFVIEHFANMTNYELCDATGLSRTTICRIQFKYKLRKSAEHYHNMGVRAGKASDKARGGKWPGMCQEVIDRRAATYRKTFQTEDLRYRWGLEQRTKIRLKKEPRRKHDQRVRLEKFGYIIDETNLVAYYTPGTHRATRLEAVPRGTTKGSIKSYYDFRPYEGGDKDRK